MQARIDRAAVNGIKTMMESINAVAVFRGIGI
jgi:hypothetical protein